MKQHIFKIILFLALVFSASSAAYSQGVTKIVTYTDEGAVSNAYYILNSESGSGINFTTMKELRRSNRESFFKFDASPRHAMTIDVFPTNTINIGLSIGDMQFMAGEDYLDVGYFDVGYTKTAYFGKHLYLKGAAMLSLSHLGYFYLMPSFGIEFSPISLWVGCNVDDDFLDGSVINVLCGISVRL